MDIAGYRINLDALLARILYRWRGRAVLGTGSLIAIALLATGAVPPVWRGAATLVVTAAPGATVTVDGRPWPLAIYAGHHRVLAQLPDGRVSWADVTIAAGETLQLAMPPGLAAPKERVLPVPAPGMRIEQVWWADGGWRVRSVPEPQVAATETAAAAGEATPEPGLTTAVSAQGLERLLTIDAYAGLADQVHVGQRLVEAAYVPDSRAAAGDRVAGAIEVRGWGAGPTVITVTQPLALLRFSPRGDALLLAERTPVGSEQVTIIRRDGGRTSLVAVPGSVMRLTWRDDGQAVVLHSRQGVRLTLTLVRLAPTVAAAVVADLDASGAAGDLVPLAWDAEGLRWVAPDDRGAPTLWRAALSDMSPERLGALDARALTSLPDGDLRALVARDGALVIGRYRGGQFIGEAAIAREAPPDLAGAWQGDTLLLQGGGRAWLLDLGAQEEKDR